MTPRRGRRLVVVLAVVGALAAVPVGVALAGGSDGSTAGDAGSAGAGNVPAQSTTPDDRQRGDGDRGDCPEKDGQSSEESTQL